MQTTIENNGGKEITNIPDVVGATVADKVVYYLATVYPDDKPLDLIVKGSGANPHSVYQTLCKLYSTDVLDKPSRQRYKLVNLNQYKHNAKDGGHLITKMFRLRGITLPPEVVSAPLVDSYEDEPDEEDCNQENCNDDKPKARPMRESLDDEDRLKQFIDGFVQSIRTKLDRFEQDLETQDY